MKNLEIQEQLAGFIWNAATNRFDIEVCGLIVAHVKTIAQVKAFSAMHHAGFFGDRAMNAVLSRDEILASLSWSEPREVPHGTASRSCAPPRPATTCSSSGGRRPRRSAISPGTPSASSRAAGRSPAGRNRPRNLSRAKEEAIALSRATDAQIEVGAPDGLHTAGYQKAGIAFSLARPASLIGDDMGLGKTIQAIGVLNGTPDAKRVLVICPASLKLNWRNELAKWGTVERWMFVVDSKDSSPGGRRCDHQL